MGSLATKKVVYSKHASGSPEVTDTCVSEYFLHFFLDPNSSDKVVAVSIISLEYLRGHFRGVMNPWSRTIVMIVGPRIRSQDARIAPSDHHVRRGS